MEFNMKRFLPALLIAALLTAGFRAGAQSDMIIKQRAKDIRDANNAQQGIAPPAAPAVPAAPAAPVVPAVPPVPQISAEQQKSIDQLTADLTAIKPGSPVPADQKLALEKDLTASAKGGTKPSKEAVTKLVGDLSAALSGKDIKERERGQLAKSINVLLNSGNVTTAQTQSFVTVAQTSLKSGGVGEADLKTVTDDLKAIVGEIQKNRPKLYQ
jgi:hypothetical protein